MRTVNLMENMKVMGALQHREANKCGFNAFSKNLGNIKFAMDREEIGVNENIETIFDRTRDKMTKVRIYLIDLLLWTELEVQYDGKKIRDRNGNEVGKTTVCAGNFLKLLTQHNETKSYVNLFKEQGEELVRLGYVPTKRIETNTPKTKYCKKVQTILNKKELTKEQQLNELFNLYIEHQAKRMKRKFEYMSEMDKGFLFNIVLKSSSYNSTADELKHKYSEYKWNDHKGFVKESSIDIIIKHGKFDEIVDIINNYLK